MNATCVIATERDYSTEELQRMADNFKPFPVKSGSTIIGMATGMRYFDNTGELVVYFEVRGDAIP